MSAAATRPSDVIIAAVATAVVHLLVFACLIGLAVLEIITSPSRVVPPPPPPEVMVEIRPEMFQRPVAPAPPRDPMEKQFARTAPNQESTVPPEETHLIGEHSTRAASELPPDPNAARLPSQDGAPPRRPGQVETMDSQFSDGEESADVVTKPTEEQPPEGDPTLKPDPSESRTPGETETKESIPPPPSAAPPEDLLTTPNRVPVPEMADGEKPQEPETLPKESDSESEAEATQPSGGAPDSRKVEEQAPQDPGFRSEVRKTRLQGSISRRGDSSRDVENTALGRYQAKLSKAVEREWQRNCIRYREHITPGMLTIRFLVDEGGDVSAFRFIEVMESSEIEKGFTLKSIQGADIPRMPKDIVDELNGQPLELIYNFFF